MEKIYRIPIAAAAALPIQRQLWLLQRVAPTVGIANISARFQWHGPMDVLAFHEANTDYVVRHPFLRTTVETCPENGLIQIGHPPTGPAITVHDIRQLPDKQRQTELERLFCQATETPIDGSSVPWIRLVVFRIEDERFEVAYVFSHLICDGLSMGILCRETLQAYDFRVRGEKPEWTQVVADDLVKRYSDTVPDDRQNRTAMPTWFQLPYDRPPRQQPRYVGKRLSFELDDVESKWVNELSRRHEVSPFITWLSLIQLVVYQYSDSNSIEIDTVTAGRVRELRRMVGPFFKTIGIRLETEPIDRFSDLLRKNQRQVEQFNSNGLHSQPSSTARSRLLLDYQASLRPVRLACGVTVIPSEWDNGAAVAELCIGIRRHKQRYLGHIKYDVDLFDLSTIRRIIAHLRMAIHSVTSHPDSAVGTINYLPKEEREILETVNRPVVPVEPPVLIDEMILQQAKRCPTAEAIVFGNESWTYGQVIQRANQFVELLRQKGIRPHDRVAICLPHGRDHVVAMIAALMCGAAYVPIDSNSPPHRQQLILKLANPAGVVIAADNTNAAPNGMIAISLKDPDLQSVSGEVGDRQHILRDPSDVAYVLFTSGSTGTPKGVEVTHSNVANFFAGVDSLAESTVPGTWLSVTNPTFDISAFELLWTLARGFKVVIADSLFECSSDTNHQFAQLVVDHGVTHFQCTPAMMQLVLAEDRNRPAMAGLSKIFVGGDVLPQPLADDLSVVAKGDVYNMYGPTETTIWSTAWKVEKQKVVRIGKPLSNQQVYVLGKDLQRKPIGVRGELFIGGSGVARGYFNNLPETNARFTNHPEFGRLFRTGDIVRLLDDGNLEFHGRNDHQVKLHGHRFELGEVEAALMDHPSVSQAIVVMDGRDQHSRLIAHISYRDTALFDETVLKTYLAARLPKYMVPSAIHVYSELALNGSGKIDRQAVALVAERSESFQRNVDLFVDSRLPLDNQHANERSWDRQRLNQLRETIREELRLDSIPDGARWSDLDISSLDVVGLVVRIERDLHLKLPVADVFRDSLIDQTLVAAVGAGPTAWEGSRLAKLAMVENHSESEVEEGLI